MDTAPQMGSHQCQTEGRINSLHLLVLFFLMQTEDDSCPLGTLLAEFSLLQKRTLSCFSAILLSSCSALSKYWCVGLLLPRCRTLHLPKAWSHFFPWVSWLWKKLHASRLRLGYCGHLDIRELSAPNFSSKRKRQALFTCVQNYIWRLLSKEGAQNWL